MIREGQGILFRFPRTDQTPGSLRPALVVHGSALLGSIGRIAPDRLARLRAQLATWIRA